MEYTIVHVCYRDAEGWECIEAVPMFGSVADSRRLSFLLSIGGEIIPEFE